MMFNTLNKHYHVVHTVLVVGILKYRKMGSKHRKALEDYNKLEMDIRNVAKEGAVL